MDGWPVTLYRAVYGPNSLTSLANAFGSGCDKLSTPSDTGGLASVGLRITLYSFWNVAISSPIWCMVPMAVA